MLYEWKLDGVIGNLGDSLTSLLAPPEYAEDPDKMYFVIGSVIDNTVIRETLDLGYKPVFINCGWRGEKLNSELLTYCEFRGVRGPLTRRELLSHQINTEVTGDPAYKIPGIVPKARYNKLSVAVPHIQDPNRHQYTKEALGVDLILQPDVTSQEELIEKINIISGASFVFAGAMHAAILSHAYKVPFALMDNGYVNVPLKWEDWLRSIGVESRAFYKTATDGRKWWIRRIEN